MIIPHSAITDIATVAAHYDDLDELYRSVWGANVHHGYWIKGNETTEEAVMNLTRLVAEQASICRAIGFAILAVATALPRSL